LSKNLVTSQLFEGTCLVRIYLCLLYAAASWLAQVDQAAAGDPTPEQSASEELPAEEHLRRWTDKDGKHHAEAVLLDVKDEIAHFRKANGKRAQIAIDRLSDEDQQYIAAVQTNAKAQPGLKQWLESSISPAKLLHRVGKALPQTDASEVAPTTPDDKPPAFPLLAPVQEDLPANLAYVQVSRRFLEDYVERSVNRHSAVNDCILGTSVSGMAHVRGATDLMLEPNADSAVARLKLSGTIHSKTVGYNGPAVIHTSSQTRFQSERKLVLDSSGLHFQPTKANAVTHSHTDGIEVYLPGLRGRIGQRIAWRRVNETRGQANAITSRHAEARIDAAFDQQTKQAVNRIHAVLAAHVPRLPYNHDQRPPQLRFSTTNDHFMVAMYRAEASVAERSLLPPPIEGNADIVARVHRVVLRRAALDPEIRASIAPMLTSLLSNRATPEARTSLKIGDKAAETDPAYELKWSADRQWLTFEFSEKHESPPELPPPNEIRPSKPPRSNSYPTVKTKPLGRAQQAVAVTGQ